MRLPHHLVRNPSGLFYFRLKVPADLRATIGVAVVKIGLRTRDPRLAQVYSHALSLRYVQAFAIGRGAAVPKPPPPPIEDVLASVGAGRERPYEVAVDASTGRVSVKTDGTARDHTNAMDALERIGVLHQHMLKPGYSPTSETEQQDRHDDDHGQQSDSAVDVGQTASIKIGNLRAL